MTDDSTEYTLLVDPGSQPSDGDAPPSPTPRLARVQREYAAFQARAAACAPREPAGFGTRHGVMLLCMGAMFSGYAARVAMSTALTGAAGISAARGLSSTDEGFVNSAFFAGYGLAMLPAGELAQQRGPQPAHRGPVRPGGGEPADP